MQVVKPYARILSIHGRSPTEEAGVAALKFVEWCGCISHRSEEKQTDTSWERFIRSVVLDHGDWSITEHSTVSVDFLVDRGITHEIVRHRLFSFTQESTRFVNYEKKMPPSFIYPNPDNWEGYIDDPTWCSFIVGAENQYKNMLAAGCAPQIARGVFPNALASKLIVTGNLRNWRHFFIMRTTKEAHPQMRQVTIPLLEEFKRLIPVLYEDIKPMARQVEGMKRGR